MDVAIQAFTNATKETGLAVSEKEKALNSLQVCWVVDSWFVWHKVSYCMFPGM